MQCNAMPKMQKQKSHLVDSKHRQHTLSRNLGKSVAVRSGDSDAVAALVLTVVGGVLRRPSLVVKTAVDLVSNTVLALDPGVEEAASLVRTILSRVALVVGSLGSASSGAGGRVVLLVLVEGVDADAHVGVVAVGIEGGVDGTTKLSRAIVARDSARCGDLVVCIASSDDNLEVVSPLAEVLGLVGRYTSTPQGALVVGERCRVGTVGGVGVESGIALAVHVEGLATSGLVTKGSTADGVVGSKSPKTHVLVGVEGSVQAGEGRSVTIGSGSAC